ncbi:MAG: TIGR03619 family F420-dependent LLM class oxidoreductase [Pseudonocardiaceae bacterium]|nr:TIGR03619 family F420-dependent LLM class oxidoreductase [Pseudonocardiaceae bacterium]
MRIGIATFVTDEGIHPATLGKAVEERGFDSLFLAEHSHIPVSRQSPYPGGGELPRVYYRTLDPFVALTAAAGATSQLLLGTGIALLVERDPIMCAKEVASLDLVSGGRAIFGVGAGWNREEMANHGTDPRIRGALFDERIAAIKEIWTQEKAEFHSRHVDFDPIYSWPKPVQRPHPPIYIGGAAEAALPRVAKYGDAWMPISAGSAEGVSGQFARLAERVGPGASVTVFAVARDAEVLAAYREAGAERALMLLPTKPTDETLRQLDELAELTGL